ncbi:MAG: lysophospholipid acyltransferase family protein [Bacteroidota bacterium]
MQKLLGYIFTPLHFIVFGLALAIFHPLQMIAFWIGGREWQRRAVNGMLFFLTKSLYLAGIHQRFINFENIPKGRPIIIVANHHHIHDITNINWIFRKFDLSFVSKAELGRKIPSISYNLRKSKSALIDRKDRRQSISEILRLAKHIEDNKSVTCIFPEGTRKHQGDLLRSFKPAGTAALIKKAPSAIVIPVAISGTWKLKFPFPFGMTLTFERLKDIEPKDFENEEEVVKECERQVHAAVIQN